MIHWKQVLGSSNVQAIAYDEENREVWVKFHPKGDVYIYEGVGPGMWDELEHSESKGRFVQIQMRRAHTARRAADEKADTGGQPPKESPE